jgi:hypothetical protein
MISSEIPKKNLNDQQHKVIENNINQDWLTTTIIQPTPSFDNLNKNKFKQIKVTKEKTIKTHLKKNIKSSTVATPTTLISNDLQQQQNNKKVLIKRSRKRTKPIVMTPSSTVIIQKNINSSSPDDDIIETFEKKSELEPLNKKLAIDKTSSYPNKNVDDLQIEQFSLLDLHSSEDDSELFVKTKKKNPIKIQNLEYNQKEIAKRTRYSSSESDSRIKINEQQHSVPKTSQKDIDKLIQLLKESSSLSPPSTSLTIQNNQTTASDTNNSSNESNDLITNKNSKRKKLVQNRTFKQPSAAINRDEFSLNNFKSLDINSDTEITNFINENSQMTTTMSSTSSTDQPHHQERQKQWNNVKLKDLLRNIKLNISIFLN